MTNLRSSQLPSTRTKFESSNQKMSFTPDTDGPSHLDSEGPASLEPQQFQVSPENTKLCIDTSSSSDDDLEMPGNLFCFVVISKLKRELSFVAIFVKCLGHTFVYKDSLIVLVDIKSAMKYKTN